MTAAPAAADLEFIVLDEDQWPPPLGRRGLRASRFEPVLEIIAERGPYGFILERDLYYRPRRMERAAKPRDSALIHLLLGTGLRLAEVCSLRLGDITLGKVRGHLKVVSGKGDKDRTLPLNADVAAALRAYYAVRPRTADEHVFLGQTGKGLSHDGLQYLLKTYGQRAGIEGLHPHLLRHTFARRMLAKGVDIATVARLLGHESVQTTMRYVEPTAQDLEDAVAKLEEEW